MRGKLGRKKKEPGRMNKLGKKWASTPLTIKSLIEKRNINWIKDIIIYPKDNIKDFLHIMVNRLVALEIYSIILELLFLQHFLCCIQCQPFIVH